jgi:hypothetical protein
VTGQSVSRGWTPQQFQQAYNIPTTRSDGKPAGYGAKIAIIGVYSYSNLQYDLNQWTKKFGLRAVNLTIINQAGTVTNNRWSLASSLATQMVATASPGAVIYVILAKSESQADIRNAMQTAVTLAVNVIVVPFGADEDLSQDFGPPSFFYRPNSTTRDPLASNAVWIAASGSSSQPSFPATHSGVIAVGGTTLSSINPFVETAWADSGAGLSVVAEMPSYQMIPSVQALNTTAYRSVPDVAFSADPEHGAQIYSSVSGGMVVMGGTAVSSALFAGIVTAAVSSRKQLDKSLLTSVPGGQGVMLQNSLYQLLSSHGGPTHSTILNDVVDGVAGEGAYPAGPGYDIATGLGSLDAQAFIDYINAQP